MSLKDLAFGSANLNPSRDFSNPCHMGALKRSNYYDKQQPIGADRTQHMASLKKTNARNHAVAAGDLHTGKRATRNSRDFFARRYS